MCYWYHGNFFPSKGYFTMANVDLIFLCSISLSKISATIKSLVCAKNLANPISLFLLPVGIAHSLLLGEH